MPEGERWTPTPDPTLLTTDQLRREVASLQALLDTKIAANTERVEELQEQVDRRLTHIQELLDTRINAQREVVESEVDARDASTSALRELMDERASAGQAALASALSAARELNAQQDLANAAAQAKAEASTAKQIDQLTTLIGTLDKATADRIGEIKERIDRGEGTSGGRQFEISERRLTVNQAIAIATVVLLALSIVLATLIAFKK